jgi:formylglycine-generating enzyme required for sulfatase activity
MIRIISFKKTKCFILIVVILFIIDFFKVLFSAFCPDDMVKILIYEKTGKRYFCIDKFEYPNKLNEMPQTQVSIYEAVNICLNAEKRLCTPTEWNTACVGEVDMKYSYGNEFIENKCNTDKGWTNRSEAAPSGSFGGCRSSIVELYDMIGNVAEWTELDVKGKCQTAKGGYWSYGSRANCSVGVCLNPAYKLIFVGFRCCKK